MLEIKGLTAHYGTSQALFGVDLAVGKGEVVALGQSLWWHWVRQGQDANNDILMKNMITKRAR